MLVKKHNGNWISDANTYLRENSLKLYMGKKTSLIMAGCTSCATFMMDKYSSK